MISARTSSSGEDTPETSSCGEDAPKTAIKLKRTFLDQMCALLQVKMSSEESCSRVTTHNSDLQKVEHYIQAMRAVFFRSPREV